MYYVCLMRTCIESAYLIDTPIKDRERERERDGAQFSSEISFELLELRRREHETRFVYVLLRSHICVLMCRCWKKRCCEYFVLFVLYHPLSTICGRSNTLARSHANTFTHTQNLNIANFVQTFNFPHISILFGVFFQLRALLFL